MFSLLQFRIVRLELGLRFVSDPNSGFILMVTVINLFDYISRNKYPVLFNFFCNFLKYFGTDAWNFSLDAGDYGTGIQDKIRLCQNHPTFLNAILPSCN